MKKIMIVLLLGATVAAANNLNDDLYDAIKKSDKDTIIKILSAIDRPITREERLAAATMVEKRRGNLANSFQLKKHERATRALIAGGGIAVMFFAVMVNAGLGNTIYSFPAPNGGYNHIVIHDAHHEPNDTDKVLIKIGTVGFFVSCAAVIGGITIDWLDTKISERRARRKLSAACYIDDRLNGGKGQLDNSSDENNK